MFISITSYENFVFKKSLKVVVVYFSLVIGGASVFRRRKNVIRYHYVDRAFYVVVEQMLFSGNWIVRSGGMRYVRPSFGYPI